jgi:hypothetical protein
VAGDRELGLSCGIWSGRGLMIRTIVELEDEFRFRRRDVLTMRVTLDYSEYPDRKAGQLSQPRSWRG